MVQSLSGKSNSTSLNEVGNDTDSVGTCDSDEGMLDQAYLKPRAMSTDRKLCVVLNACCTRSHSSSCLAYAVHRAN